MSISKTFPIFDGHNDTLLSLTSPIDGKQRSFFERSEHGHIDLPRAREGGFGGGMFAVFVRPDSTVIDRSKYRAVVTEKGFEASQLPPEKLSYSQNVALSLMADLFRLEAASEGQIQVVRKADELAQCLKDGILAIVLHFEGAEPIDPNLDALHVFYQAGLRSVGITWSRPNIFGYGVPFKYPSSPDTGPGLTEAGKDLVRECNRLGIVVDLAHLNEKGFWDVENISESPLVVTHAGVHAICATCRNLTDKQLDAVGESGGIVGVTFCTTDLRDDGKYKADTPIATIVRHIEYIADRIGIDHVALGSDFDGATIPQELGDVSGLPKLMTAFQERGYDDAALRKITHENWIRVLRKTWKSS